MAHQEQRDFCESIRRRFPEKFTNVAVLDVGSLDINGSNRSLFDKSDYIGIDVGPGPNVDVVAVAHQYNKPDYYFDTIISTEAFEHDQYLAATLQNIVRMLKPGGLFLFTCATTGRPEHGTRRAHAGSSPLTASITGWQDYYHNVTPRDICDAINVSMCFVEYCFKVEQYDLYFYGIKRSFSTRRGVRAAGVELRRRHNLMIGIPVLNRPDLLARAIDSFDVAADVVVICNSRDSALQAEVGRVCSERNAMCLQQQHNIGVAASWNLIVQCGIDLEYERVLIASNDVVFCRGTIERGLAHPFCEDVAILALDGFNAFFISPQTVATVGWFDECFYPAYKEDQDYMYRCRLAGRDIVQVPDAKILHDGSMTIRSEPRYFEANENTHFNWNRNHYICKWGGDAGEERFKHPYNETAFDWRYWPDPGETIRIRDWDENGAKTSI